jgi:D-glycero-D-manno-heptose 1,7-bisphosphate phosphatase
MATTATARAVFLDRDGVLNRAIVRAGKPYPPDSLAELEVLPGVAEACNALHDAGFKLVLVTNQPDIRRGKQSLAAVESMHDALRQQLPLDAVKLCPHDDADACQCRKPLPGMLIEAAKELSLSLPDSVMVGDRWRDVECGERAGCRTVFIDRGYDEPRPPSPSLTVAELPLAVPWILNLPSRK